MSFWGPRMTEFLRRFGEKYPGDHARIGLMSPYAARIEVNRILGVDVPNDHPEVVADAWLRRMDEIGRFPYSISIYGDDMKGA